MSQPGLPVFFFGYPLRAKLRRDAILAAAKRLQRSAAIEARTWEELKVAGRFVIDEILCAIDGADVAAFDVTELNHNVMFEIGYAIGKDRRI